MEKSIIKNISLSIACLLGVGGAITAGVLSTNSPSINNAEATTYGLHVGNIEVTNEKLTVDSSDTTDIKSGSATYNPETKTLTLDNFNYQGAGYTGAWEAGVIDCKGDDLTILLKGNNSILKQNDNSMSNSYGIYFSGEGKSLTIDEDSSGGSLTISFWTDRSGGKSNGIFLEPGSFVMNGGSVVSNAGRGDESAGIYADSGITFNGGSFTGRGYTTTAYESRGIYAHGVITINGGEVFGYAPLDNPYAAYGYDNYEIRFKEGDLYAEGKTAFKSASYVYYPSGTTILGGDNQASATVQSNVSGGLHYYHLSFTTHEHNWSYTADGASITAECHNSGCPITTGLTLTVSDPADIVYDGTTKDIQLNSYNKKVFDTPEIKYYKDNVLVSECINAGSYEARVSANGKTAIKSFSITKADGTLTPPTAKPIIGYTGSAQKLVNAGSTSDGTIYYRLEGGEYSANIPTAIDPGTYNVYYKLIGDDNHNDGPELGPIESTILNGAAAVTAGTTTTVYGTLAEALSAWNLADAGATLTLLRDLTTSSSITISGNKILDLNGFGIRASGTGYNIIVVSSGNYLTINDSDQGHEHAITLEGWRGTAVSDGTGTTSVDSNGNGTAYITGGYITGGKITSGSNKGACIYINGGTVDLYNGSLIGNYISYTGCDGGGIFAENNGYFTMYGGSIKYNYSGNSGGGIGTNNSTIEINGGVISYNRNNWSGGGAISIYNESSLKLYGGVIENNVSYHADGAICFKSDNQYFGIKGSPIVRNNTSIKTGNVLNLFLNTGVVAKLEDPLSEKADIHLGIINNDTRIITDGWSTKMAGKDPTDYFLSDNPNYSVYLNTGEAYYGETPAAKVRNGETITYYDNFTDAVSAWNSASSGATLTMLKDATISTAIVVNDNSNKVIDLNGFTLSGTPGTNQTIVHVNGGTVTINGNGGTLCKGSGYHNGSFTRGGAIAVYADGTKMGNVTINDCNITNNSANFGGAIFVSIGNTATLNNCKVFSNDTTSDPSWGLKGAIYVEDVGATVNVNGGEIYGNDGGILLWGNDQNKSSLANLNGVYIHDNERFGVRLNGNDNGSPALTITGDTIIKNNGTSTSSGAPINLRINNSNNAIIAIDSELGDNASIGVTLTNNTGVFTSGWSTVMGDAKPSDYFFSDNPSYHVYLKDGEAYLGAGHTVTFNTNGRGIAPDPVIVDDGSLVNKPTDPTVEGYEVKGWYKEAECENIWDFDNDTVTEDITLYASWDYDAATANVIKLINDIGTLTYDGGSNDSLDDILAAKTAYDALTPGRKVIVDGVNKDILDHDVTTYRNVDKVGDLIKAIPDAKPSKDYYDAVDLAKTEYDKLTTEEVTILNTTINFEQFLNDDIAVKEVVIEIEEIGEVGDDPISQEKIQKARASYDSLSEDQKRLIAPEVLRALEEKESAYNALSSKGNATLVVLYTIFGILLLVGIIYFFFLVRKKKNNDDNDNGSNNGNKGAVRLASFTGLTPFIIYVSHYLGTGYIILYVIIALTVIVWATDLAIIIYKKKHKNEKMVEEAKQVETTKPGESVKPEFKNEHEPVNEDDEVITITDEKGNIFNIRYIKSFTAKHIQSTDETKKYYEELKNYVLSYKKTTSRVSWHYDSINSGRNQVLKFAIRGKTLCVYYPLNASDYEDSKYKVEAVESKKFEEVPCLYRIKNDRRLGYAKDLIDTVMNNLGIVKGEEQHEVYSDLPYEPNAPLIARGLIKELKVQVNKPVAPVVIKAEEVDVKMSDEEAASQIKEDSGSNKHIGKKGIVNIDTIAKSFANNEVVNIESLWEKKIISKNIGYVKVLARGSLDKKLHIELQDYSLQAVKMILLAGGTVKRVK